MALEKRDTSRRGAAARKPSPPMPTTLAIDVPVGPRSRTAIACVPEAAAVVSDLPDVIEFAVYVRRPHDFYAPAVFWSIVTGFI